MLEQLLEIILDIKGNISPVKFRKEYFIKHNKSDIYDWFELISLKFPEYKSREIVLLLQHGYKEPPKCIICGLNSKVQVYKDKNKPTFEYCSRTCSLKSPLRALNISNTKLNKSSSDNLDINIKRSNTMLEKYGVSYNSQRSDIKVILSEKLSKAQISIDVREKLLDRDWLYQEYVTNKRTGVDIADELNIFYGTVLEYCRSYGFIIKRASSTSLPQKQIYNFISDNYTGEVLYNDWEILGNLELDIYIPELKLAIEHNGLPYHSKDYSCNKNKFRHIIKTNRCEELGINLLHIRGDQWIQKKDIVKSIINHKLGNSSSLYARKCSIIELNSTDTALFLEKNHIQGTASSLYRYALTYNNEIVAVMTFSKSRFNSNYSYELVRYCNLVNTNVVGGFSKLLKHFKKYNHGSIISYCDRSRSSGEVYLKNNFKLIEKSIVPSYSWTDNHKVYNRLQYTRKTIEKKISNVDMNLTVNENMFNNKFRLIFDSGQLAFIQE